MDRLLTAADVEAVTVDGVDVIVAREGDVDDMVAVFVRFEGRFVPFGATPWASVVDSVFNGSDGRRYPSGPYRLVRDGLRGWCAAPVV